MNAASSNRGVLKGWSALAVGLAWAAGGCLEARNLGTSVPHDPRLPVDERNPIVLTNDGPNDNWQGEYAILLANSGGPPLVDIIVNTSGPWPDIDENIAGWRGLVSAAKRSGMRNVPEPITSIGRALVRPASGAIEDTAPNRSEGALRILDKSRTVSLPYRPLVVVTGGRLTDVADAYLIDATVAERVVVVASLGTATSSGGAMGIPNGEMDPWADAIVSARLRFVQVSAYYSQAGDVPSTRLSELPANPFGEWIAAKQSKVWSLAQAADQVSVLTVGLPGFVAAVERVSPSTPGGAGASAGPDLLADDKGLAWLVRENASAAAAERFWQALLAPSTFSQEGR
jgi:hypothetical protein